MGNSNPKLQGALGDKVNSLIIIEFEHCGQYWKDPNCASEEEKKEFWGRA